MISFLMYLWEQLTFGVEMFFALLTMGQDHLDEEL